MAYAKIDKEAGKISFRVFTRSDIHKDDCETRFDVKVGPEGKDQLGLTLRSRVPNRAGKKISVADALIVPKDSPVDWDGKPARHRIIEALAVIVDKEELIQVLKGLLDKLEKAEVHA